MTTLIEKVRLDSIEARKRADKTAAALLTTLFAEASRVGKDAGNRASTDAEVIQTVKKFKNNAEETLKVAREDTKDKIRAEIAILNDYLPQELTPAELESAIAEIVASLGEKSPKIMGKVMSGLKDRFAGRYDGKLASELVKTALS